VLQHALKHLPSVKIHNELAEHFAGRSDRD
jgi:hypothetical protein